MHGSYPIRKEMLAISPDDSIKLSGYDKAVCFVAARWFPEALNCAP